MKNTMKFLIFLSGILITSVIGCTSKTQFNVISPTEQDSIEKIKFDSIIKAKQDSITATNLDTIREDTLVFEVK